MATLDAAAERKLKDSDFAYIDKDGGRHLPIHDEAHVRAAMARFNQTQFESSSAKDAARAKVIAAARRFGIKVEGFSGGKAAREPAVEYKTLPFHTISPTEMELEEDEFAGHGATWDFDGFDIIEKGGFARSLPEYKQAGVVCWQHDWKEPIGKPREAHEDEKGLFVRGKISRTTKGNDALVLLRDGVVTKLSIGYETVKSRILSDAEGVERLGEQKYAQAREHLPWDRPGIRLLEEVKLFEVSPVTIPMNVHAAITSVKSGLPAGLMLDEQVEYTLAVNDDLIERYGNVRELRMKAGRMLSSANHAKLRDVHDRLMAQLQALDDLLDSMLPADAGEPDGKAAEHVAELKSLAITEMARFQRTLARMNGAA